MILETPNYIISYKALNAHSHHEEGTILSPVKDPTEAMDRSGYRKIEILSVKVNK